MTSEASPVLRSRTVTLLMLAAVAASLLVSTAAPMATAVVGLILFGVLHNLLEIRYVVGRFSSLLTPPFLYLLATLVGAVAVSRLLSGVAPGPARLAEIVLGYAILAAAAQHGLDGRRRVTAWVLLALGAAVSLAFPAYHFLALTHLHNLVPLFFLWDWSRRIASPRGRRAFRAVQVLWAVVVPVVLLAGLVPWALSAHPGMVSSVVGDGQSFLASVTPPGAAGPIAVRVLVVFAFAQTMHYVVWVALLPRVAPDASAAFEARVPWATGPRLWAAGFVAAAVFAVLFGVDFDQGKTLYAALASCTTYLELPVLLVLLAGGAPTAGGSGGTVIPLPATRTVTTDLPAGTPNEAPDEAGRHSA